MKKITAGLLLCVLLLALCGCGDYVSLMPGGAALEEETAEVFEAKSVSELLSWDSFMSSYYDDTPVALSKKGPEGYSSPVFDRESIIKACDAIRGMTASEKLDGEALSDGQETMFCFTMKDGSTREIRFVDRALRCVSGDYAVTGGEALWDIVFPGYDEGFGVFDLYFDGKVTQFAENFASDTPVSVGRRTNGGAMLSNQDPEMVRTIFALFSEAVVESVESNPDQNIDLNTVQEYVFTMQDGSTRSFVLTGGCLTVTVDEAYGPVYYHISSGEQLKNITVTAQVNTAVFEGGTLDLLRSDIARAVAVANGEYVAPVQQPGESAGDQETRESDEEDGEESENGDETAEDPAALTVAGVYITFKIDGTEDYVSLQGDDAKAFVQMLGTMQVLSERPAGEPVEAPVTVSVNLSDWSGPIVYFCDGAVQQSVGNWYMVDESQYAAMQSRVMELYWAQVETRSVETTETDGEQP